MRRIRKYMKISVIVATNLLILFSVMGVLSKLNTHPSLNFLQPSQNDTDYYLSLTPSIGEITFGTNISDGTVYQEICSIDQNYFEVDSEKSGLNYKIDLTFYLDTNHTSYDVQKIKLQYFLSNFRGDDEVTIFLGDEYGVEHSLGKIDEGDNHLMKKYYNIPSAKTQYIRFVSSKFQNNFTMDINFIEIFYLEDYRDSIQI